MLLMLLIFPTLLFLSGVNSQVAMRPHRRSVILLRPHHLAAVHFSSLSGK